MTKIEWATHTSNWLAGCTKVSPACSHCYAETMSARLATMPQAPQRYRDGVVEGRRWTGEVSYDAAALHSAFVDLVSDLNPRRVFINSMSDTFHESAPAHSLADLARYIRADEFGGAIGSTDHVIMLLTKRPKRMLEWQREHFPDGLPDWVWVGTTVEDQRRADERVPVLLQVQTAGVRFLSVEPLLGAVSLDRWIGPDTWPGSRLLECDDHTVVGDEAACRGCPSGGPECAGRWDRGLHWVIAGCESGAGRRETSVDWVRALRDDCTAAGVPFFLKQLYTDGRKVGLPELDGVVHAAVPGAS